LTAGSIDGTHTAGGPNQLWHYHSSALKVRVDADQVVVHTHRADLQEIAGIVATNATAPQELAALFAPYLYLLQLDPVEYAISFAAGAPAWLPKRMH
jgi:hypothetical protein